MPGYTGSEDPATENIRTLSGRQAGKQGWQFFRQAVDVVDNRIVIRAKDALHIIIGIYIERQAVTEYALAIQLFDSLFGVMPQMLRDSFINIGGFTIGHQQDQLAFFLLPGQMVASMPHPCALTDHRAYRRDAPWHHHRSAL